METVLSVCVIVITAAVVVKTVYFIIAMIQIRRTAAEIERIAFMVNKLSPFLDMVFLGGGLFAKVAGKITDIFLKKEKGGRKNER
jgi:hypothetical protein